MCRLCGNDGFYFDRKKFNLRIGNRLKNNLKLIGLVGDQLNIGNFLVK